MNQVAESQQVSAWRTVFLLAVMMAVLVSACGAAWWLWAGQPSSRTSLLDVLFKGLIVWGLLFVTSVLVWRGVLHGIRGLVHHPRVHPTDLEVEAGLPDVNAQIQTHLREHHGQFWRRRVRLYVVIGESTAVEAVAPGLTHQLWLTGKDVVLLWGGSAQTAIDKALIEQWCTLGHRGGLHGTLWVVNQAQYSDSASFGGIVSRLQELARLLGWKLSLHVWQVCDSDWAQPARDVRAVGCQLPSRFTAVQLAECLDNLQQSLREQGLAQIQGQTAHDFLLRLARDLQVDGADRWYRVLKSLSGRAMRDVRVRGLWFSLPVHSSGSVPAIDHHWPEDPAWSGILSDRSARPRRLGWSLARVVYASALGLAAVWAIGLLASFTSNRVEVSRVEAAYWALQQPAAGSDSSLALAELVRELSRLSYRGEHGAPWYQRFGLNRSDDLREAVWPLYVEANERLLRDPAAS
ncbi:type VI secretion protein VasK, partial [Pseudomonas fulva]|nr:type VI secretion protein VasK [Pseudomonas fulva]MBF8699484.1 type VI secretion protein VasK [Pseudomonas fulva]